MEVKLVIYHIVHDMGDDNVHNKTSITRTKFWLKNKS